MAKPCTPHLIPQAEQFFEIETANVGGRGALPSRSLGVPKGIFSFAKENIPFAPAARRRHILRTCAKPIVPFIYNKGNRFALALAVDEC